MGQYAYLKRAFLNPRSTGFTSYIYAEAENSENGEYKQGNYLLTIADCKRRIDLEFFLGTKRYRRQSLKKLNLMMQVVTRFKEAVEKESKLIDEYSANEAKRPLQKSEAVSRARRPRPARESGQGIPD